MNLLQAQSMVRFIRQSMERDGRVKTNDGRTGSYRKVMVSATEHPDVFDVVVLADFPWPDSGTYREAVHFTSIVA